MSKLGNRFGIDVEKIKTRVFEYGGHVFRVRIPTMGEINAYEEKLEAEKGNTEAINKIYLERAKGLVAGEDVEILADDIKVKGRSLKESALNEYISQIRITWLFNLLVKENDDGLGDLTYEDISADLPIQIQIEMVDLIAKTMHPDLEETKKKSTVTPPSSSDST